MYAAISGLQAHQTMLDVTANNLANVDTIGYKAQRTTFVNELSQLLNGGSGPTGSNAGTNPMQIGLGAEVGSIDNIMGAGSMESTGNTLDVAIQGDGFLCIGEGSAPAPPASEPLVPLPPTAIAATPPIALASLQFTRAGNLTTNSVGYLTTSNGEYVMGSNVPVTGAATGTLASNTLIYIPPGSTNVSIGADGSVSYTDNGADANAGQTVVAGYIALASFPNEAGLERNGGSTWSASPNSGAASYGTPDAGSFATSQTISGELEQSNVDMSTEFTNMIEAERGYQANSSVISTADTMMQTLIQMSQAG
jgi:flagellar hook protein FlgE